jgi:ornithine cyclodeaminase/alanine dehydrogenase-like protein (mu-crystallin family)
MPREVTVLTESDLRRLVRLDLPAIDVVERAFAALASGAVVMPPVLSMAIPEANGEVDVKTAYIPGFDGFAIKVSPGFFDNPKIGLPSLNGLMILFSAKTGLVEALLLDNGYLTDVRTAAAGVWRGGTPPELGEIAAGRRKGRVSDGEITICDLTGTGAQDTAIASFAVDAARRAGAGSSILT